MNEITETALTGSEIAIIGLSCRFPGAQDAATFWQNIVQKKASIRFFSDAEMLENGVDESTLQQHNYVKANGVLSGVEQFDAAFFDISPAEAELIDPQHRVFLEQAWLTLEDAGYAEQDPACAVGVFAGSGMNTYLLHHLYPNRQRLKATERYLWMLGNDKDFLTTRVSYKLNLRGPSINVQTACSTSLVAVHSACQSLLSGECDMALAGGVSIHLPQVAGYAYQDGMIFSPDGHCRAFAADAQGTVAASGVGVVLLKPLSEALADRDCVHAVIKGSAINNDGALKMGFTAPSVEGQAAVIAEAQAVAEVPAESIRYIEAHGTGTVLGDPIEIQALTRAFRKTTEKRQFCALGSVKSNIGHTNNAAGIAGLIKTVFALKQGKLPPNLHGGASNPHIDFARSPFYLCETLTAWPTQAYPRRAGVSAFGVGGTNAHVVLEQAPQVPPSDPARGAQLLVLSAKTPAALAAASDHLVGYLREHPTVNVADVAYTLAVGRKAFAYRRMLVAEQAAEVIEQLPQAPILAAKASPMVMFLLPGQGTQTVNVGRALYQQEPVFREQVDACSAHLAATLGVSLAALLYPPADQLEAATAQLKTTAIAQPAVFVLAYAMAKMWAAYGIQPNALLGHSLGEYVAACLAGVFTWQDGLDLVAARGRMMQALPGGAMLSVALSASEVQPLVGDALCLAAMNSPQQSVLAGTHSAITQQQAAFDAQGIRCQRLNVSHAFHSKGMQPMLQAFAERVRQVPLQAPTIPYISNVTGTWIRPDEATNPDYWAQHLRQTVRFSAGVQLALNTASVLLDIGPGNTLGRLAKQQGDTTNTCAIVSGLGHSAQTDSGLGGWLHALGQCWLSALPVQWSVLYASSVRQRLSLPTYAFATPRHWVDAQDQVAEHTAVTVAQSIVPVGQARPQMVTAYVAPRTPQEQAVAAQWQALLGIEQIGVHDDFFALGGDSLLALQLIASLRALDIHLPTQGLLSTPTIAAMVARAGVDTATMDLLVRLQTGDAQQRPLFLLHPVGGSVYFYRALAHALPSAQPVYAVQAQGLEGDAPVLHSIESMATRYLEVIRQQQPQGPYCLGGASFGGMLAFEMAQQLRLQGEAVALLAMLDSPGPKHLPAEFERDAQILAYVLEVGLGLPVPETFAALSLAQQVRFLLDQQAASGQRLLPDLSGTQATQLLAVFKSNSQAMAAYVAKPYAGRILFLRAEQASAYTVEHPEQAWLPFATQGLEVIATPGNHISMMLPPHVQAVAQHLALALQAADPKAG